MANALIPYSDRDAPRPPLGARLANYLKEFALRQGRALAEAFKDEALNVVRGFVFAILGLGSTVFAAKGHGGSSLGIILLMVFGLISLSGGLITTVTAVADLVQAYFDYADDTEEHLLQTVMAQRVHSTGDFAWQHEADRALTGQRGSLDDIEFDD